ncbi:MAG TPA: GldG family protein [Nevskiaceae bacterium]
MNQRRSKLAQQWLNAVLAIVIVGLLAWLTVHYKTEFDWTANHRNTLTAASQRLLKALPDPIHFYGFVFGDESGQRQAITNAVDKYEKAKGNVTLQFVDPSREPQKVKEFGVTQPGQLVVEYQGRHEALERITEPAISDALERLAHATQTYIGFLGGDGERDIAGADQNGYSGFAAALRNKGFKVTTINLAVQPVIPDNLSVLVIAAPRNQMLPQQQAIIARYVAHGGNLLWLGDVDEHDVLPALAQQLGVQWLPGYVVFPNYRELGIGSPGIYLAAQYPDNPVTGSFKEITVFPLVRAMRYGENKSAGWHAAPILTTDAAAWTNAQGGSGPIRFDAKNGDVQGPLTIGVALTRPAPDNPSGKAAPASAASSAKPAAGAGAGIDGDKSEKEKQRVVVVGNADFLSNGNVNLLGNKALGTDIVTWLANRSLALSIQIPEAPDRNLFLTGWESWMITGGYVVVLPLILILFGVSRWAIRRRR